MPRAHGHIIDPQGKRVAGTVYVYRKTESKEHTAVLFEDGGIVGPGTTTYTYTGLQCSAIPNKDIGFFDVPNGLDEGEYALHVHYKGKKEWAWPFIVTDGKDAQDVRLGGPNSTPVFVDLKRLLLFGDSDSSPKGETLSWRSTDITYYLHLDSELAKALACKSLHAVNYAQGATPVHPAHMDHDGITQVREALAHTPKAHVAVCRYGLNDCHSYMQNPTPASREKFRTAYSQCIQMLLDHGAMVVLVTIQLEKRSDRRAGILAANEELKGLASKHNVLLVDPEIVWEKDKHLFHTDGIHLLDAGQKKVAEVIKAGILKNVDYIPEQPPIDPPSTEEISINDVEFTYDPLPIASWKETVKLRGVSITGTEGDPAGKIKFDWDAPNWPQVDIFGEGSLAIGNPVVVVNKGGKWLGASFTWLRPGQKEKNREEIDNPTIKKGPLVGWKPRKGEKVYFLITGLCRESQRSIQERTNMVPYTF